jgi:hypothetical protein
MAPCCQGACFHWACAASTLIKALSSQRTNPSSEALREFDPLFAAESSLTWEEPMRKVKDFSDLNLPEKYIFLLRVFLANISKLKSVKRIILFGSCARGSMHAKSDIDLFVIIDKEPTSDEEDYVYMDCAPNPKECVLNYDIIAQSEEKYEKYKDNPYMVQKRVERDGVDLTGLL